MSEDILINVKAVEACRLQPFYNAEVKLKVKSKVIVKTDIPTSIIRIHKLAIICL